MPKGFLPMNELLRAAAADGYAVPSFCAWNAESMITVLSVAADLRAPVILMNGPGEYPLLGPSDMAAVAHTVIRRFSQPVALHLDHGNSVPLVCECLAAGYTSVMLDFSQRPYRENAAAQREVVQLAHPRGVTVEGELGTLGGIEDEIAASHIILTNPEDAKKFVEQTGVDALAIAIGTSHGAYKFKATPTLAMDIVEKTHKLIPNTYLVMHGSSSVPKELVDEVNKFGGKVPNAMGVPIHMIQQAIKLGVRKINIDTDGRLAFTAAIRKYFVEHPEGFDQRKYLGEARQAIFTWIQSKMKDFGTAGHANDYKGITLKDTMARYAK